MRESIVDPRYTAFRSKFACRHPMDDSGASTRWRWRRWEAMVFHDVVSTCVHAPMTRGMWCASVRGRCSDPGSQSRAGSSIPVRPFTWVWGSDFPFPFASDKLRRRGSGSPCQVGCPGVDGPSGVVSWFSTPQVGASRGGDASTAFPPHIGDVHARLGGAGPKVGGTRSRWTRPGPSQNRLERWYRQSTRVGRERPWCGTNQESASGEKANMQTPQYDLYGLEVRNRPMERT